MEDIQENVDILDDVSKEKSRARIKEDLTKFLNLILR